MVDYVKFTKNKLELFVPKHQLKKLREKYPDRYFEDLGIVIREDGVMLKKWQYGDEYQRIQTLVKYETLDSILRFLGKHYPNSYREERQKITGLRKNVKELNQQLNQWKKLSEAEKETISKAIVNLAEDLPDPKRAKNEQKQEARTDLIEAHDFEDYRGQKNPGAMRAVLVAASNRLEQRTKQLDRIKFKYEFKKLFLAAIRKEFGKRFRKAQTQLMGIRRSIENIKPNYDVLSKLQNRIKKELVQDLGKFVLVPPYKDYFSELHRLLSVKLKSNKVKNLIEEAIQETDRALRHIHRQQVQSNLE